MLTIYVRALDYLDLMRQLQMNFANLYAWIPDDRYYGWWPLGVIFAACVVLLVAVAVYRSAVQITAGLTVFLATYSVLVVPYVLPRMHDRYYFPADVIAIVLAFYLPRYWYVPVVVGAVSVSLYVRYMATPDGYEESYDHFVSLEWLAFVPAALILALSWQLYMKLKPQTAGQSAS